MSKKKDEAAVKAICDKCGERFDYERTDIWKGTNMGWKAYELPPLVNCPACKAGCTEVR